MATGFTLIDMPANPCHWTTAQQRAFMLARDAAEREDTNDAPESLESHEIVSVSNGQKYGKEGWIPCDHYCEFRYNDGSAKHVRSIGANFELKWFNGAVGV